MCDLPNDLKPIYESWLCRWHKQDDIQDHNKYIKKDNEWGYSVNTNPFIAIETHINEDTITDLLAHILQTDEEIKMEFINFLLNKANKEKIIKEEVKKTEIETQYYIQNQGKKSRLDLFIKIPNKYYIIIENKIFDAPEQPKQMERYIGGIQSLYEAQNKDIIAFYATVEGTEECRTAGKYKNRISKLTFYKEDDPTSIYSFLNNYREKNTLVKFFLEYLKYTFFDSNSKVFFEDIIETHKGNLEKLQLDDVFIKGSQRIQKSVNEYDSPKEFFYQLLKVHILNQYIISLFNNSDKDMINYSYVFSGIKLKKEIENYSVCFETKYWYNSYYIVITVCSKKSIPKKALKALFDEVSDHVETKQNKTNGEYEYSLWLWILDYDVYEKYIDKIDDKIIKNNWKTYSKYIELICKKCMKKIFENICKRIKKINKEQQKQDVNKPNDIDKKTKQDGDMPYYIYKNLPY